MTPYLSTINTLLDLKLFHISPKELYPKKSGKGWIAGVLAERKQKQCQPWEKLGTPISYQVIEF